MAISATYSYDTDPNDSDQDIDALMSGRYWNIAVLTFSFPDDPADYGYSSYSGPGDNFAALSPQGQDVMRTALGSIAEFTLVGFQELGDDPGENDAAAVIKVAQTDQTNTAFAYYPSNSEIGGDIWVRNTPPGWDSDGFDTPVMGKWGYFTVFHELGHAMGLKHGHETSGPGALTAAHDGMEFSVMTYRSHPAGGTGGYTNESYGYAQSFMMYDIAALQRLYGADFGHEAGDTVYSFSASTGEMFIDGVGQGTPGANRIFRTVWDGDGEDSYDLSNYTSDLDINLQPGGWSDFSATSNAQNARLGSDVYALGHLYNALQYGSDKRSLIENALGGSGDDRIQGNAVANKLTGAGGDDRLYGGSGKDTLFGGDGDDVLAGGNGIDLIVDGTGKDRLKGGGKQDSFVFVDDDIRDVLVGYEVGEHIDISDWGLSGMSDVKIREWANGNVVIAEKGGGESVLIKNHTDSTGGPAFSSVDFDASVLIF